MRVFFASLAVVAAFATTSSAAIVITEVHPNGSSNGTPYSGDWFELTNFGTTAVSLEGWKMDDSSNDSSLAVDLFGIASIAPGQSVVFLETSELGKLDLFKTAWFGSDVPADFLIGAYAGSGVGLSSGGDAVVIFNAMGEVVTGVSFGSSTLHNTRTFDNAAGLGGTTSPYPLLTTISEIGVNGAFMAVNGTEIGSPGSIAAVPEPSSLALLTVCGLGGVALRRKYRTARS